MAINPIHTFCHIIRIPYSGINNFPGTYQNHWKSLLKYKLLKLSRRIMMMIITIIIIIIISTIVLDFFGQVLPRTSMTYMWLYDILWGLRFNPGEPSGKVIRIIFTKGPRDVGKNFNIHCEAVFCGLDPSYIAWWCFRPFHHQEFQVPKMEVLNLIRLFGGWVFPYISRIHTAYIGVSYLHFRYQRTVWWFHPHQQIHTWT